MRTVRDILADGLKRNPLTVLLFGPNLKETPSDPHAKALRDKRAEICDVLRADGHKVVIIEDEIDATVPQPLNNAMLQEMAILRSYDEYDLVIALIYTPGTNLELGIVASQQEIARKAHLFLCDAFSSGASWSACELAAQHHSAEFTPYAYPDDLTHCHLLTRVQEKVRKVQAGKFLF